MQMEIAHHMDAAGGAARVVAEQSFREPATWALGYRIMGNGAAAHDPAGTSDRAYGLLTTAMMVDDSDAVDLSALHNPHLSGGVAFLIARDLTTPPASVEEAIEAIELVFPALDIAERVAADQPSGSGEAVAAQNPGGYVILGDGGRPPSLIDLACCGAVLEIDGELASSGAGAAVLGHPARALPWLGRLLGDVGETVRAGAIIIVSEITRPVPLTSRRHARLAVGGLGSASVRFG